MAFAHTRQLMETKDVSRQCVLPQRLKGRATKCPMTAAKWPNSSHRQSNAAHSDAVRHIVMKRLKNTAMTQACSTAQTTHHEAPPEQQNSHVTRESYQMKPSTFHFGTVVRSETQPAKTRPVTARHAKGIVLHPALSQSSTLQVYDMWMKRENLHVLAPKHCSSCGRTPTRSAHPFRPRIRFLIVLPETVYRPVSHSPPTSLPGGHYFPNAPPLSCPSCRSRPLLYR